MDVLTKTLVDYGALGLLSAVLLWELAYLQKKMFTILENNTKALTDLKSIIEKCTYKHER